MAQHRQAASAQTAVRTSSSARTSRSQRNVVLQRATSSPSKIGLKRWRVCCRRYVLLFSFPPPDCAYLFPFSTTMTRHPLILSPLRFRSSIPGQTLHHISAHPLNLNSELRIPLPFPHAEKLHMFTLPSQKTP